MRTYERGEGPGTVVFLHGFPELALSWRRQFEGLADTYRLVAPDLRGYGGTDAPEGIAAYGMDHLCEDVADLIDVLGEDKVHLVGHDWGGAVGWEFAQRHGNRLHSLAVVNCPPTQIMLEDFFNIGQLRRSWYVFFFQLPWLPEFLLGRDGEAALRNAFTREAANPEALLAEPLEPFVRILEGNLTGPINYYRANLRRPPLTRAPIRVPTRLVWGLGDYVLGDHLADVRLYEGWVDDFVLDPIGSSQASHWAHIEAAERVNASLREHFVHATGRAVPA